MMVTRRIVRTFIKVASAAAVLLILLALLDRNFRVLPKTIHEFLPQHHAGSVITDITITSCSTLNPFSSCKLDESKWHRINKDLYLGKTMTSSAYLHIQRKKEEELLPEDRVVMDVKVGRIDPSVGAKGSAAPDVEERWESRPAGLWLKRSAKRHASDSKRAVTAVDMLFGDDAVEAREGWAIVGTPLLLDGASAKVPSAHLTVRRGSAHEAYKPVPRVKDTGRFKIVQLADLHLATGVGKCRDAVPDSYHGGKCEADPRTLEFVGKILDEEKPDLVVLSGDQVNGDTAPDAQSAIFKYAQLLIQRKIPYVSIFGNHDDEETPMSRAAQMSLIETLPYSLSVAGPDDIDGVGNYFIEVLAQGTSKHSAVTIWLLDSHSYTPDERHYKGYDWIKDNQIEWFRNTAEGLKKKHSEYTKIHMNLAFIHIPLPEYRDQRLYFKGNWTEAPTAPVFNSHFRDALVEQKVVMVSAGHDHVNEYCMLSETAPPQTPAEANDKPPTTPSQPALWMCYGGGAGFGGYAGYGGFHRKIRVFDLDMELGRITTYKRAEAGPWVDKKIDEQIIVDEGRPAPAVEGV